MQAFSSAMASPKSRSLPQATVDGSWIMYRLPGVISSVSRCIENEILMFLRKSSQYRSEISIDEPLNIDWDGNELLLSDVLGTDEDIVNRGIEAEAEKSVLRQAIDGLEPREKRIMQMRFGLLGGREKTQKEVADEIGISQSYISRLEKKIIRRLKTEMEQV